MFLCVTVVLLHSPPSILCVCRLLVLEDTIHQNTRLRCPETHSATSQQPSALKRLLHQLQRNIKLLLPAINFQSSSIKLWSIFSKLESPVMPSKISGKSIIYKSFSLAAVSQWPEIVTHLTRHCWSQLF